MRKFSRGRLGNSLNRSGDGLRQRGRGRHPSYFAPVMERLEERVVLDAGGLDGSFGTGGKVLTDSGVLGQDTGSALVAYPATGGLVAAGSLIAGSAADFLVVRYHPDGSLDSSFAGDGIQTIDFASGDDVARAVAVDSLGRLVVAGSTRGSDSQNDFAVARLTPDGILDASFGSAGIQTIRFDDADAYATGVAVDSLDRVIVSGSSPGGGAAADFVVARLTAAGEIDLTFSADGKQVVDFGGTSDIATGLAIDAFDRPIVAGYSQQPTSGNDFAVTRLDATGELDGSFGAFGIQTIDFGLQQDFAKGIDLDSQGRIVLAGSTRSDSSDRDVAVARLTDDGQLDTDFADDGTQTIDFGTPYDDASDVAVDSYDRVVVAGLIVDLEGSTQADFAATRLGSDGQLDLNFGTQGKQTVDFGDTADFLQAISVDAQDRVILLGFSHQAETQRDIAVTRLLAGDPPVNDATVQIDIHPGQDSKSINLNSNGKVKVAILSTTSFDAPAEVDPQSLRFGRTGEEDSLLRHQKWGTPQIRIEDVNGDGLLDLVASFRINAAGFQQGDTEGVLRGQTLEGHAIEGRDDVQIHGKFKQPRVTAAGRQRSSKAMLPAVESGDDSVPSSERPQLAADDWARKVDAAMRKLLRQS